MKKIKLTRGKYTLVDDDIFELLNKQKWCFLEAGSHGYAERKENNKIIRMHRQILKIENGNLVDHINGNGLDNRRENLRICNNKENSWNSKLSKKNTSGFKGVDYKGKGWRVRIMVNYKYIYLGNFKNKIEAAEIYNRAAIKYFGNFAKLNLLK